MKIQRRLDEVVRGQIRVVEAHDTQIDEWIAARHYLGYAPPGARLRLWVFQGDRVIGAMMWGHPCARHLDQERILELTRMVFVDDTDRFVESRALALARAHIRRHFPGVKGLLAYSSTAQGHEGTVYQADGWFCVGKSGGGKWSNRKRQRRDADPSPKLKWVRSP